MFSFRHNHFFFILILILVLFLICDYCSNSNETFAINDQFPYKTLKCRKRNPNKKLAQVGSENSGISKNISIKKK
jgi:hypothetical protein